MASEHERSGWRFLHPASLVIRLVGLAKGLIVPGIIVLWFASGEAWEVWLMIMFIPSTLYTLFRYFTLRYSFAQEEMVIQEGLIFRKERHIPFARIQNVDLVQSILHRFLRVARIRLETAGGAEPEAALDALSLAAVEEIRTRVFARRERESIAPSADSTPGDSHPPLADEPQVSEPAVPIVHLSLLELVQLGLISSRIWAALALALGLAWQFDLYERLNAKGWFSFFWYYTDAWQRNLVIALGLVAALPVLMLLSIFWTIVRMHDFRLVRVGEDLRLSCGLFTRRSATVPRHRIQLLCVRKTLLHRLFRCVSVRIETAAGSALNREHGDDASLSQKWLVPLLPVHEVPRVVRELQPELQATDPQWKPLAAKAQRRMIKRNLIWALILSALVAIPLWPWGLIAVVPFSLYAVWHAGRSARLMTYACTPGGIVFRSGVLTRKVSSVLFSKIQVVSLGQSPFDRRHRMASVSVDTAGAGPAGHRIRVPYLEESVARELTATLYKQTDALQEKLSCLNEFSQPATSSY